MKNPNLFNLYYTDTFFKIKIIRKRLQYNEEHFNLNT